MTDTSQPVIRLADATDVGEVWDVIASCRIALRERGIMQWDTIYPSVDTVENDIANETLFVLSAEQTCVGIVTLDANADSAYASLQWKFEEPALIVHRLCIRPGLQGRGFGHQLMQFAEGRVSAGEHKSIRLDAYSENVSAVRFYQQRGYRQVGQLFFPRRTRPFFLFEWAAAE